MFSSMFGGGSAPAADPEHDSLWKYTAKGIDGDDVDLKQFSGSVALVVNTASK